MYLENSIEKERYNKQREELLIKIQELKSQQSQLSDSKELIFENIEHFPELCKTPVKTHDSGIQKEKRELLEIITSNLTVSERKLSFTMVSLYAELVNRDILYKCALKRNSHQTLYSKIVFTDNWNAVNLNSIDVNNTTQTIIMLLFDDTEMYHWFK